MIPLSATLTHGLRYFWSYLAVAALAGVVLAWLIAHRRARARAAAALEDLGRPGAGLEGIADGEVAVLSGVLQIDGAAALAQDPFDGGPAGPAATSSTAAVFLVVGHTRVTLEGDLQLRSGSRERWGLRAPTAPRDPFVLRAKRGRIRLHPVGRWLAHRQRTRVRGILRVRSDAGEHPYREQDRRYAMVGELARGGVELAVERGPRIRLHPVATAAALAMAAALYVGFTYVAGWVGAHMAWKLAVEERGEPQARRVIRWATLGAATPFHRQRSLDAIESALRVTDVQDPQAQRGFVSLAASYEHYRTGGCRETLFWVERTAAAAFTAELAERCGDAESLRVAAKARLVLGEHDPAADLVARAAALDRSRPPAQVLLERSAFLLTGRLERAAAAIRETQARVGDFYVHPDQGEQLAQWRARLQGVLGCAADQLSARAGDGAAHARLQAASTGSMPRVRWTCALLLADLASGAERLALADRIRADATGQATHDGAQKPGRSLEVEPLEGVRGSATSDPDRHSTTLDLLELEADPARARAGDASIRVPSVTSARILAGAAPTDPVDPVKWAALERLASVADPSPQVRRRRAILAAELVVFASLLGDDDAALRCTEMLDQDREALRREQQGAPADMAADEELAILRAYIELRAGRAPTRPIRPGATSSRLDLVDGRRELEGVLDFVERGHLDRLRELVERPTFAHDPGVLHGVYEGLRVAAPGSGDALAQWLGKMREETAVPVALVGARRVTTGRPAMLAWLRRTRPERSRFLTELAIDAANRQKIAEALGDHSLAAGYRAQAERMRRGLLRRDTALVRRLLAVD